MSFIAYAIFGLVAGALARMLHPGSDPMNWVWTMILGIAGAVVGGLIGEHLLGVDTKNGLMAWIAAVGGAILLLAGYHAMTARGAVARDGAIARGGPATSDDYKKAVFDDLAGGPKN